MTLTLLPGIRPLMQRYDGIVLDLWGVVHDGIGVFPWVNDTLRQLKAAGKRVVLLSNVPRRIAVTMERNARIGLDNGLVDGLMTSGEAAWWHLYERPDAFYPGLGRRCLHIGGERDITIRDGLDYDFVTDTAEAEFLFNTGSRNDDGSPPADQPLLMAAAARGLPMVCANPDVAVIVAGKQQECAGAIARRYEALGGAVRYHGKPYAEIYAPVLEMLGLPQERCLAVGDSLHTDIPGAARAGIDSLLVVEGIHRREMDPAGSGDPDPAALTALVEAYGLAPDAAVPRFTW